MNNSAADQHSDCTAVLFWVAIFNLGTPTCVFGGLETPEKEEKAADAGR